MKPKTKESKISKIIYYTIIALLILLLVYVLIFRIQGKNIKFFGYSFHIVVTDSMTPEINVDDFVLARDVDINKIKIGDDVVYIADSGILKGKNIIHRVIAINFDENGELYLTTQGIKDGAQPDSQKITKIEGKFVAKSMVLGRVMSFITNPINIAFIIILLLFLKIIIRLIKNIIKSSKKE